MEKKVLTWKNLRKRGWFGSGFCSLCRREEDFVDHLFIECAFNKAYYVFVVGDLNMNLEWGEGGLSDSFKVWYVKA